MKTRFTSSLILLLAMLSLGLPRVPAQVVTSGRLTGVVTDKNGAVISKAEVVAVNDQTKSEYKVKTDAEGGWSVPSVPNGVYTVTVTSPGFKSTVVQNVKV